MYHKAKLHKDKQSQCKVCMKRIAEQDPEYAARISKLAAAEDKMRKRKR